MPAYTWTILDILIVIISIALLGAVLGVNIGVGVSTPVMLFILAVLVILRGVVPRLG